MNSPRRNPLRERAAWGGLGLALFLFASLSFSVPAAVAQGAQSRDAERERYFQVFENVYDFILDNYVDEVEAKKLYEGAMKGMFEALGDPYSVFLDEAMMSDMTDVTEGKFGGIGLYISKQARDPRQPEDAPRYIEIVSPIEDTPGWRAGFKPGDLIVEIEGESTAPFSTDEAQSRLRGKPGTPITVKVRRGSSVFLDFTVTRAVIEIPTIRKALIPTGRGQVAYLRIIDFTPQTLPRVQEAIKEFNAAGYVGMVVDVRSNPGGLLQSVIQISDLFLSKGVIVSTRGRNPSENSVSRARPDLSVPADKPVVLLINRGSASASEILAGALKDNKRAYLIGENSYGKGSVQQIFPVDGTGFKLTMARYYTPSDENIDKTGIPPDLVAAEPEPTESENQAFEKLYEAGLIREFAEKNPEADKAKRDAYARELRAKGYGLSERLLQRLLRDELARTKPTVAYDLEFDEALNAALATLAKPDFDRLLAQTKSVKELVAEKKASEAAKSPAAAAPAPKP